MKIKILIAAMLIIGSSAIAKGQGAQFTNINPDAKSTALGNAGYALDANAFSIFNNTAAIAFQNNMLEAGYSFNRYQPNRDMFSGMHSLGGYYRVAERHSVALGFRYLGYKAITDRIDANNVNLPDFTPSEMAVELGYAFRINHIFSLGANVRYINSNISDTNDSPNYKVGNAFAGDISFLYRENNLSASIGAYNLGTKIDYGYRQNDLGSQIKAGVAYEWCFDTVHFVTGTAQGAYHLNADDNLDQGTNVSGQKFFAGIGAEYSYAKQYSARLGYHIGDKVTSYFTVGFGVNIDPFTLDFAYIRGNQESHLDQGMLIGLSVKF